MALSLGIALWSRRGHGQQGARAFFTASGQFGAVLFFFLSVGETYSIASMLGFPGGVYAGGDAFVLWFFGYILLACCCLFFLGPWIWRAGRLYGSATIPDFFRDHWNSRALELLVAVTSIILLLPIGTMQFTGLRLVLGGLAPEARPLLLTGAAGLLCFAYVVIAGLRASAFVAVLKDVLMMGSILLVGGLAIADWQAVPTVAQAAAPAVAATPPDMVFAISTILLQAVGFTMIPQNWAFLFSARDPQAIRRAQVAAPLYMLMFPLLMATATYAQGHGIVPAQPDYVFLAVAEVLLHPAATGMVMAAVALSGLVILSSVCLAIGPLVTRNLAPGLSSAGQQRWSRWVVAAFLLLSLLSAEGGGTLMARLNNLFYFGVVQTLPGFIAALLLPRVPVAAVIGGIVVGDGVVLALWLGEVPVGGLNLGVIGLAANIAVLAGVTLLRPRVDGRSVVAAMKAGG
ncbi:sodium:solute symporter family protein [Croceibacterium mercuriale]|uniref:sodium:solute symporter family protein n=1 Tax=Croceibacterium mercuriale TaxID=1572751 RepID=UPI00068D0D1A|nr:hypothetical protein [Croceibacterium mercuriale]